MGSPRSPKSPKTHKTRFRMPWDYRKKTGSPRIFFKGGDFVRLMSSRDKKNARATLEAQQYLDGVYRACAVAGAEGGASACSSGGSGPRAVTALPTCCF